MATSSVTSSLGGTYGLSGSGVDVDAIVKKLMTGQQSVDDGLAQKKTVLQWQKAAYNTVYDDINTFRNTAFNFKLQATLSPNKVSSSNTSVATATANAGAADVNHTLIVGQLASGVNLTSSTGITTGADKTTLADQMGVASSFSITIANGTSSTPISITKDESINDVVSAINAANINVQASYDSTLDRFFLSTTNTGSSANISITSTDAAGSSFVNGLNLGITIPAGAGGVSSATIAGQDKGQNAIFKLDGASLTEASNIFTISGVTYNLTGTTSGATVNVDGKTVDGGQASSISVTNDVDTAVASIQTLVDSYNKILDELNTKVKETRYTDYPPLTDAQKASMKDTDITAWNAKAQSGMLHNDNTLSTLVSTLRNAISSPVSGITGSYNSAASIGITTGDYTEGGKLHLDTDKLKAALTASPTVLNQLFGATGTTTVAGVTTTNSQNEGIAGRLYDGIKTAMDKLNTIAGTTTSAQYDASSNMAKSIISYNKQITDATAKFTSMQKAYYTQYNAMEVALQSLTSQSSWISSQLGSSSGG